MDNNDKKKRSGFNKPWAISPQLQKIVGVQQMARTEVHCGVKEMPILQVIVVANSDFIGCQKDVGVHSREEFAKSEG